MDQTPTQFPEFNFIETLGCEPLYLQSEREGVTRSFIPYQPQNNTINYSLILGLVVHQSHLYVKLDCKRLNSQ